MKRFEIHAQKKPWYGSGYRVITVEARNLNSAIKKACKEEPDAVWYWHDGEVVHVNRKRLDWFQKLNPGVVFHHF